MSERMSPQEFVGEKMDVNKKENEDIFKKRHLGFWNRIAPKAYLFSGILGLASGGLAELAVHEKEERGETTIPFKEGATQTSANVELIASLGLLAAAVGKSRQNREKMEKLMTNSPEE